MLSALCAVLLLLASIAPTDASRSGWGNNTVREPGRCSLSSETCGSKGGVFGTPLPCIGNDLATDLDPATRATLESVCGPELAASWSNRACCNSEALEKLSSSLSQAAAFISLCPACSKSFTSFYCHFTCSPDQSTFVTVSQVQELGDSKGPAVKAVELHVDQQFGSSFFDACKDVKFAATNGFAMDFIGGGAKDWLSFLRYMGQERPGLGSPFQINFPQPPNSLNGSIDNSIHPLNPPSYSCSSEDPAIGCACADCPARCLSLPALPDTTSHCHIGILTCGSFFLVIAYAVVLLSFILGIGLKDLWSRRHAFFSKRSGGRIQLPVSPREYDRMDLTDPLAPDNEEEGGPNSNANNGQASWTNRFKSLIGARSTSQAYDGDSIARSTSTRQEPQSGASSAQLRDSDSNNTLSRHRLGRGASLLSPDILATYSQPRTYRLNSILGDAFYKLGFACACAPFLTLAIGLTICGVLNAGWSKFKVEKDPVRLWVAHDSELAQQQRTFEQDFGPFYRTEQIFISSSIDKQAPFFNWSTVQWWSGIEADIRLLASPAGTTLKDVCFAPSAPSQQSAEVKDCTVQSFMGYYADSLDKITDETWASELDFCATTPSACLSAAGQPLNPRVLFGGIPGYSGNRNYTEPRIPASQARAAVITYVVNNSLDPAAIKKVEEWERALKGYFQALSKEARATHGVDINFSTGVSLEEELNKSTNTDIPIVVLSYLLMFFYVSISLGGTGAGLVRLLWALLVSAGSTLTGRRASTGPIALGNTQSRNASSSASVSSARPTIGTAVRNLFVDSKFSLGLFGIAIVLLSVSTSVGIFSFFGVRVTLIIAEVIPFLVLAIGVDNVFILAHELDRQNARAYSSMPRHVSADDYFDASELPPAEERVAKALSRMGPSIMLSSSCQAVAFALGTTVGMPAVRNFAIYAAGAVVINALLQVTVFVSAMTIDLKRLESSRVDCLPCIRFGGNGDKLPALTESLIVRFIRSVYAPFILRKQVKYAILALFSGLFVASWICTDYITLGLDQKLALPRRSYLVDYFSDLQTYLDVGPPVYFVTSEVDVTQRTGQQKLCGRFSTCEHFSLANVLEAERKRPESSYISEPPAVWLDDFFQWLNPALESCCAVKKRRPTDFCGPDDSELICKPCYEDAEPGWNITMEGLPEGPEFLRYLRHWLESPTNADCALGGQAGYSTALSLGENDVKASHFRTYHTPLKTQNDFINALAAAKRISADLSERTGGKVFPYSLPYVFFEQYSTIVTTTRFVLALALLAVFLVTSLVIGSSRTGFVVVTTVFLIVMNVMGVMGLWHVSLNALSLVNLVICVGIGVEFCAHIARAFMGAGGTGLPHSHPAGQRERDDRAYAALVDVGSSVFTGITLTKLIGISVLALTRSKLLETYYFRMWLTLILSGALHGLVFLPVALSFQGGSGYSLDDKEDEQYIEEVARYRGRPFLAGDSDVSDDDQF